MNYDVIIVGAGPGGIFSAYELTRLRPELKVAVFEAGHPLKNRRCPIDGVRVKSCIACKSSRNTKGGALPCTMLQGSCTMTARRRPPRALRGYAP